MLLFRRDVYTLGLRMLLLILSFPFSLGDGSTQDPLFDAAILPPDAPVAELTSSLPPRWKPTRAFSTMVDSPFAQDFVPYSLVASLTAQVDADEVYTYTGQLSGEWPIIVGEQSYLITTRHTDSGIPIEKATQYVYECMVRLGLDVSYQPWSSDPYSGRNVIGELPGELYPDEVVLVTAHLDDMPPVGIAPGADDNASGSTAVLVSAEILSGYRFARTLRFVFFTGEEQGLLGSKAYADQLAAANQDVVAVYNMDMIAWDMIAGPTLRLHTRRTSDSGYAADLAIAGVFTNVVQSYGLSAHLTPIIAADGIPYSDHASFWAVGYPGILAIEDDVDDFNTHYHTSNDKLSDLNMDYYVSYVRASVGTAAHLAQPLAPDVVVTLNSTPSSLVFSGAEVIYTLAFENSGNFNAVDLTLSAELSNGVITVTDVAYAGSSVTPVSGAATYNWDAANLAPGAGGLITLTGVLDTGLAEGMVLLNQATASIPAAELQTDNNSATVIQTVVHAPPLAMGDAYTLTEDIPFTATLSVLANDVDVDGDPLSVKVQASPAWGSLTWRDGGYFTYTPTQDFFGTDSFTYAAFDGIQASEPVTVVLNVTPVNDPPQVSPLGDRTLYGQQKISPLVFSVADSETASADLLLSVATSNAALVPSASISFGGAEMTRTLMFTPTASLTGTALITLSVSDGELITQRAFTLRVLPGASVYLPLLQRF